MIFEFGDREYINVEQIDSLRWFDDKETGIAIIRGAKLALTEEEFNTIEKAYIWLHQTHMYCKDLSRWKNKGD